jgi:hypothetical protein
MKTFKEFEDYKKIPIEGFGNEFNYSIEWLEDLYVAKINGVNQIKTWLLQWDLDARKKILALVAKRCSERGIVEFDYSEFDEVLK